jgi:methylated-DNA-[protein]-cysteine S-methyltransferase
LHTSLAYYASPIGLIEIEATEAGVTSLVFVERRRRATGAGSMARAAVRELEEYFKEGRRVFDVPLVPGGTEFQLRVWRELATIPFGRTVSYQDIARAIGSPSAVRAVGAANGRNPISIMVPCHRVVGSDGRLTGYGGGLWRKEWLLRHEGAVLL